MTPGFGWSFPAISRLHRESGKAGLILQFVKWTLIIFGHVILLSVASIQQTLPFFLESLVSSDCDLR